MKEELIAPCGMNCALCVSYQFMQKDLNRQGFQRKYCPGCLPRGEHCLHMAGSCRRLGKGELRFCFLCEAFPCVRLKALDKRYRDKYGMSMVENLKRIRAQGMESFLEKERAKWRCPACGGVLCCHTGKCLQCEPPVPRGSGKAGQKEEQADGHAQ